MMVAGARDATDAFGWGWQAAAPAMSPDSGSRARRVLKALLGAAVLAALLLTLGFAAFVASLARNEGEPAGPSDAIVALTGGTQRIGDAIDLLAKGYGRRLLITGVNERTSRDEIARLNPGQRALFDCCVDLDYRARNTIGNAIETRRWVRDHGFGSLIVVTSNYHMHRTLVELDHALPGARKVAHPVVPEAMRREGWWRSHATLRLLGSEYLKLIVVWLRTRFESDPEGSTAAVLMGGRQPVRLAAKPPMR